jgi:hypothetical protein
MSDLCDYCPDPTVCNKWGECFYDIPTNKEGSMQTYSQLSIAEQVIARSNFGENVHNMMYNFKDMVAIETDNDGKEVHVNPMEIDLESTGGEEC